MAPKIMLLLCSALLRMILCSGSTRSALAPPGLLCVLGPLPWTECHILRTSLSQCSASLCWCSFQTVEMGILSQRYRGGLKKALSSVSP